MGASVNAGTLLLLGLRRGMIAPMAEPAFEIIHPDSRAPSGLIFVCDHASNALPPAYGTLGLDAGAFAAHIAYDIGAAEVTRALAAAYGAPAVLARFSRLADRSQPRRGRSHPGHETVGRAHRAGQPRCRMRRRSRAASTTYHRPYHAAIEAEIAAARAGGQVPVLISMHSFTPILEG